MSDEDEKLIEKTFITTLGAKYPFVQAKGCNEKYGIGYFPSIYCIDPSGVVHSVPDDRMPSEADIEELLKSVSLAPPTPDEARYGPLKAMWEKRDYPKVRDYLAKTLTAPNLDPAMHDVLAKHQAELDKRASSQLERVESLGQGPDYAASLVQLEAIEKDWKGFPASDAAKQQQQRFQTDAAIKKELAAAKALQKLLETYDPSKLSQARKLVGELGKFAEKHAGTLAAKQAEAQRGKLLGR